GGDFDPNTSSTTEFVEGNSINAFTFNHSLVAPAGTAKITLSNVEASFATENTLPVSLTSFTAEKQNSVVKLNWTTASEQKNSHFDVLRSSDGKAFHSIAEVAGAGDLNEVRHYSYRDNNPFPGVNYYKLRQVDFDGTATESDIKAVTLN